MRSSSGSAHRCRQRGWRGTEGLWHRVFINYGTTLNLTNQAGGLTDIPWGTVVQVNGSFNDVRRGNSALANLSSIEGQLMIGNGQVTTIQPAGGELDINGLYYNYGCNYSACLDVSYGSTVNIVGDVYNWGGEISTGAQGGGGNVLNISGRLYSDGQITLGSYGNTGDVLNTGSLENRGSAYIDFGSTLNVAGDLINAGLLQTGNQGVGGNAITVGGTLVNSGTLFLNEPGDVVNAGQLMIAAGSQMGNGTPPRAVRREPASLRWP